MSVKELKFIWPNGSILRFYKMEDDFVIMSDGQATIIDRNQAHLLKLWLEEHLK